MNEFTIPTRWLTSKIDVLILGAGGTGSFVSNKLLLLHRALSEINPDGGFNSIDIYDPKDVTNTGLGRTPYLQNEVGINKAIATATKLNIASGSDIFHGYDTAFNSGNLRHYDLIITATDNAKSRMKIANSGNQTNNDTLWLDMGVHNNTGNIVLGQTKEQNNKLPNAYDLFSALASVDDSANREPSCDMITSLSRQHFGINDFVATLGVNLIAQLFLNGKITVNGAMVDLLTLESTPIKICSQSYALFGYEQLQTA